MNTRRWFRVHSFTGVITGLLLFMICWSGTFATLAHEFDWLVTPQARVTPSGEPQGWASLVAAVRARFPDSQVKRVEAPLYRRSAAEFIVDRPRQERVRVYVNPYTAEVQGQASHLNLWRFFRSFHRRFFMQPAAAGVLLVSAFGITLLISGVAALFFYKRWWRRFFRFKPRRGPVFWSELHKTGGLWSLWFVVLMGITGTWYGLEYTRAFDRIFERSPPPQPIEARADETVLPFSRLMSTAREARPDLAISQIALPGGLAGMALGVRGQADDILVRDRVNQVAVDAYSGEVVLNSTAADLNAYERWIHTVDPLHFGDFGGLWSKGVYFVFGLALCGLVLTGTYLHARRLVRRGGRAGRHHWQGTLTAVALSLAVLVAAIPFGFHEARTFYGPELEGKPQLPELLPGVRYFLIGWIALTALLVLFWTLLLARPHWLLRR